MSRFDGQWHWTNTLQQVSDGLTKVQARQRLVEILRRGYHALKFDPTFTAGKKLTTERQQRENELHQAAEFGANILCRDEVLLTSEASGSVSLRSMSMCDAGYSGRTVKIVKELREKFSDHSSPFAHPVRCMDPLRSTLHKIYSQHAPTKLSRVDEILSKHEGHGQLLLCVLICKYNLSLVSVLSLLEGKSSNVPIGTGPVSASLLRSTRWERVDKRMLSRRHAKAPNVNVRKRIYMTQSLVALVRMVVSGGEAFPSLLVGYGSATLEK